MRLLIAVPSLDYIHASFAESLVKLTMRLKDDGVDFDVRICTGTLVYIARDKLANEAIDGGFSHVLWLDSDMVFTPDLLDDLTFSGADVVTGIAVARRYPFVSCIFKELRPVERINLDEMPREPFEIGGCGFACVLCTVDALRSVKERTGQMFLPEADLGEDLAFCQRYRDGGGKIYADPSVKIGHVGHITIYPDDVGRLAGDLKTI